MGIVTINVAISIILNSTGLSSHRTIVCIALVGVSVTGTWSMASESDNRNFQRRPAVCTEQYAPVCGIKNGVTKTYSNSCFAAAGGGAKVIAQGPCR
jgi:hypothetical protein